MDLNFPLIFQACFSFFSVEGDCTPSTFMTFLYGPWIFKNQLLKSFFFQKFDLGFSIQNGLV